MTPFSVKPFLEHSKKHRYAVGLVARQSMQALLRDAELMAKEAKEGVLPLNAAWLPSSKILMLPSNVGKLLFRVIPDEAAEEQIKGLRVTYLDSDRDLRHLFPEAETLEGRVS